jgi:polyhydroxybutyrate depolymerase
MLPTWWRHCGEYDVRRWLTLFLLLLASPALADEDATLPFQGIARLYRLHVPPGLAAPAPLVIALHGLGETIEQVQESWTMDAVADRESFTVVYPHAVYDRWSYSPARPVTLPDGSGLVDDVGFIGALIDHLVATGRADPAKVYVAGLSNGGLMTWTLICAAPERFAAAAPMITGMLEAQRDACHPARQIPVVAIDGTDDYVQVYDGWLYKEYRLLGVADTMEFWRRLRGCTLQAGDYVPAHEKADLTRALWVDWTECQDPAKLRLYRVMGGGHSLPSYAPIEPAQRIRHGGRSQSIETAETLWSFFKSGGTAPP